MALLTKIFILPLRKSIRSNLMPIVRYQQVHNASPIKTYRKEHLRKIVGNREQVGFGCNGEPAYYDCVIFPFPAIRYKEPSPEICALREKEKGDWKQLTLDEKKSLYRASFRLTFSEFLAPTGKWKSQVGWALLLTSFGLWLSVFMHKCVYSQLPVPLIFTDEGYRAQLRRRIDLHDEEIFGLSAAWDYEKKNWRKPDEPFALPNPFIDPCTGDWEENDYSQKPQ